MSELTYGKIIHTLMVIISLIVIVLILTTDFAAFYLTGYYSGNRYSCLSCEYTTTLDLIMQIIILIIAIIQFIISLNEILPNRFLKIEKSIVPKIGFVFSISIIIATIIGLISFGVQYSDYEWWPETITYAALVMGVVNLLFNYLLSKEN